MNANIMRGLAAGLLFFLAPLQSHGQRGVPDPNAPTHRHSYTFEQLGQPSNLTLLGIHNAELIEFPMRRDRIATKATLDLVYTPSPALLPTVSQLRVLLNEELMAVLPITADQAGEQVRRSVQLDARHIADFNRLRLEFVGHYTATCEDLSHSSLWLDISRRSGLVLEEQTLLVKDDLAYFPEPFFDYRARERLSLPFVFGSAPNINIQKAAGILASYFGARAGWRGANFPVRFNELPQSNAVVFASNDQRPDFLQGYPKVEAPTVAMVSHPGNPYVKLLLVLGRDESDLIQAALALATNSQLLRGDRVTIKSTPPLQARRPYDAPNWTRTDRPVHFSDLQEFSDQFQVSGLRPRPVELNLNLPPDLFVWRNAGIPLNLKYRSTALPDAGASRLDVSLNAQFIASLPLNASGSAGDGRFLRLALKPGGGDPGASDDIEIPAIKVGARNQLRLDFSYANAPGTIVQQGQCSTRLPQSAHAAIDGDSTFDFSGFKHYMALPDLHAFGSAGFPFSRLADLSETMVVVPAEANPDQVGLLLDMLAGIGARTGYPATHFQLTSDWSQAVAADADVLALGPMPAELRGQPDSHSLFDITKRWLKQSRIYGFMSAHAADVPSEPPPAMPQAFMASAAPIAAIVGSESPFHAKRSVVSLLASTSEDYALLRQALADPGQRLAMKGSVAIVRDSGVSSDMVGPVYYVGSLPWWTRLWFHMSDSPWWPVAASFLLMLILAGAAWRGLRRISQRRLRRQPEDRA